MASQIKLTWLKKKPEKVKAFIRMPKSCSKTFPHGPSASVVFFNGNAAKLDHSDFASIESERQQPWCGSLPLSHPR
jgi:hypothetical protein